MTEENINISLTKSEAIVLFEFLSRFEKFEKLTLEDQSEEQALWNLNCLLEKKLSEPFNNEYPQILKEARETLNNIKK